MTTFRTIAIGILCLGLGAAAAVGQEVSPQAAPAEKADQEPTFEQRLNIHPINEHVLRGALPEGEDFDILAKQKGVTRIICLLEEKEIPAGERQAAEQAGMKFEHHPLGVDVDRPVEEARVDRAAARRIVDLLKSATEGVTYVHGKSGRDRCGFIEFAYRVLVDDWDFAQALRQAIIRGFVAGRMPGFVKDMKLFASGLEELPAIRGIGISDHDLLSRGETITVGGVRLNVKKMGEGPAVFVIHGGPGETHTQYRPYLDALAKGRTLVYYDQRGCGHSGRPQLTDLYTFDRLVKELEGLREKLGHESISLVAHSSGGVVALKYALAHRDRVDKLVIASSWASAEDFVRSSGLIQGLMSAEDVVAYNSFNAKAHQERRSLNDAEFSELLKLAYPYNFFGVMPAPFREDWNRRAQVSAMVLYALARECFGKYDVREQLAELAGLPTLVIAGKFDVITSPSIMKPIADGIAGARLEVFDRSGHFPFVEEHDKFIEMVSAFLSAETAGPGAPASPSSSLP